MFVRNLTIFTCIVVIAGCGFQPIFKAESSKSINNELRFIDIQPIENRIGQQLRNSLVQDISPLGRIGLIKYQLNVTLAETKSNLAIKKSEISTRANLIFQANYTLTLKSTGEVLTSGQSHMVTSYNILTQTYATLIAEKDARRRAVREISADITTKVVSYFRMFNENSDKSG